MKLCFDFFVYVCVFRGSNILTSSTTEDTKVHKGNASEKIGGPQ